MKTLRDQGARWGLKGRQAGSSDSHGRRGRRRPMRVEALEERCLMAAPVVDAIAAASIPAFKTVIVPVTASDADGDALTYTATSSNPQVTVKVHAGNPFLKMSVAGFGDLVFQLFQDITPNTVAKIQTLVQSGFYNNLTFHRVVPNFVIQGGDPNGTGSGGPGFTFDDEFVPSAIFSGNGQLAMANSGKDTNGSQFFVTIGPQRFLDFNHTIWGQLVRGFDVLNKINAVPTGANNKPITPVVITSATIIADPTDTVLTLATTAATGSTTITVTANDGHGGTSNKTFTAQVVTDTTVDPPILDSVSNQTTHLNQPVTFNLTQININQPPTAVDFAAQVTDATSNGTVTVNGSAVTVTPKPGFTGTIHLIVGVREHGATSRGSDQTNPYDTQKINVVVRPTMVIGDYDGDRKADLATFRPTTTQWLLNRSAAGPAAVQFGGPGDIPVSGDFDGDGKTDLAVFRPSTNQWLILQSTAGPKVVQFGGPGDFPVPGDYDGDGKTDLAVFRSSTGQWLIQQSTAGPKVIQFGAPGFVDFPVPGDYDGDGKTDLAVFRLSKAQWFIQQSTAGPRSIQFGAGGIDVPIPADYDGDGKADIAVFRPTTGQWLVQGSSSASLSIQFGGPGDIPEPNDYDGDGKADLAVFRPSTATWYILQSTAGPRVKQFGAAGIDVPLNTPLIYRYNGSFGKSLSVKGSLAGASSSTQGVSVRTVTRGVATGPVDDTPVIVALPAPGSTNPISAPSSISTGSTRRRADLLSQAVAMENPSGR